MEGGAQDKMNLITKARKGIITGSVRKVARDEGIDPRRLSARVRQGHCIILKHKSPLGIGKGLSVKINSNIGTSPKHCDLAEELRKLDVSIRYGADTVMDLSTAMISETRKAVLKRSSVPIGTVPIYQAIVERKGIEKVEADDIFYAVEKQLKEGISFITVHCGVTMKNVELAKKRVTGIVSRGGSFLARWMKHNKAENPLYAEYDRLLEIAAKYDAVLSLGDGLRPGCIADATDKAQLHELRILGRLAKRALDYGVQSMIEGPGHVPLNQIERNMRLQQKYCNNAPFYVLGPLVTDVAPGYDHITGAIGGTLAAYYGADYLCYVTPSEHLRLPTVEDVKEGVIASKIAAHAADIAKGSKKAFDYDLKFSRARKKFDWEKQFRLALDPEKAKEYRKDSEADSKVCTMCGKYCSMK